MLNRHDDTDESAGMNPLVLNTWKGYLQHAEAVLAASPAPAPKDASKALADVTSSLAGALGYVDQLRAELHATQLQLQATAARYEALIRSLPIPVIVTSASGDIVDLNPLAAKLLNISARAAPRRSLLLFFVDDRATWPSALRDLRETDPPLVRVVTLRPREMAPKNIRATVSLAADHSLYWFFDSALS